MRKLLKTILDALYDASYWTDSTFDEDGYCNDDAEEVVNLYTANEIASNAVESYLNGSHSEWIPVSSGVLPTKSELYLVTKMNPNDGEPIYDTVHEVFWTSDNKWDCERDPDNEWIVTAWREKLEPYKI